VFAHLAEERPCAGRVADALVARQQRRKYFREVVRIVPRRALERPDGRSAVSGIDLKHITDQLLVRNPSYRCSRCGFGARSHHWQCPSCKEWGTVKPLLNYAVV
jgi:lipopolysaccharide biosynthesis regulator YciM